MYTKTTNLYIRSLTSLSLKDFPLVGGKNASLGEMMQALEFEGIQIPKGFAITVDAYRDYLKANNLTEKIKFYLTELEQGNISLEKAGKFIRRLFYQSPLPESIQTEITNAYAELCRFYHTERVDVAVRSSATAEDLPNASFAGQQESYLNICGSGEVLEACRKCYASLFTDRAISYRNTKGFDHLEVALSIGIQKMVRSDLASAGVMFSIDPETGFNNIILITGAWGLGENVVQGTVNPDEFRVFQPLLDRPSLQPIIEKTLGSKEKKLIYAQGIFQQTRQVETSGCERQSLILRDAEILQLAQWANRIEEHYARPMDIEWAKDGITGELFILQARPETVQSRQRQGILKTYQLKQSHQPILTGLSVGAAIATGKVCLIEDAEQIDQFEDGAILVTKMTDPDWVPVMKRAAGIVTDSGGRTCHAAIISRELGIPAVVGTGRATQLLQQYQEITISCAEGDRGQIYNGILDYEQSEVSLEGVPETKTRIMLNIASSAAAFKWWKLPVNGIGLARMEFIINSVIKIHPLALVHFEQLSDLEVKQQIQQITQGYKDKKEYFVDKLAQGIAKIAASQYPEPVIVRMSDFKTNEYADLIGGRQFEPSEANPMLGFRGASRYYSPRYREGFALECQAIKRVREVIGLDNVIIMIPFCRRLQEADRVLSVLAENGLQRGENGLLVYVMCEVPSNVELAAEFSQRFDGFSIGTNDLTQLVLGIDRDSEELAELFDERDLAVKRMIRRLIKAAHQQGRKVGICGQAPSDHPDFATFLVEAGIDSISLNPDSAISVKQQVAQTEAKLEQGLQKTICEGAAPEFDSGACVARQEQMTSADLSADLKEMPPQWLASLHQASSQLSGKKVIELIKAIPPAKAPLAARLQTLAENYQFDEIVRLLNFSSD
ncbi:MAG: phosphoenolpyruvate synthase [Pleurocapsa sp. MO_226.B13]|nr:phosphoenolpyruvate synthase [Pleurocapsa sp. MO_226.B13]